MKKKRIIICTLLIICSICACKKTELTHIENKTTNNTTEFLISENQDTEVGITEEIEQTNQETISYTNYEDIFIANQNDMFDEYIKNNPIDKQYVVNESETIEMINSYYDNRNAWFTQCQYTVEKLNMLMTDQEFSYIESAFENWKNYYDSQLRFNQEMFYMGKVAGEGISYLQTANISNNLTKEMAIILLGYEYQITGQVDFICGDVVEDGETEFFRYENTCIASEMEFYHMLNEGNYVNDKSEMAWIDMMNVSKVNLSEMCTSTCIDMLDKEISAWIETVKNLHEIELILYSEKQDVVEQVYLTRMKQLVVRLNAMQYQIELYQQ